MKNTFNMISCIKSLTKNDVGELEDIISHKYFKFLKFYNILKSFEDKLSILQYHNDTDRAILSIDISYDSEDIIESLSLYVIENQLSVVVVINSNIANITITED